MKESLRDFLLLVFISFRQFSLLILYKRVIVQPARRREGSAGRRRKIKKPFPSISDGVVGGDSEMKPDRSENSSAWMCLNFKAHIFRCFQVK